jgi:tetratricopeptide (TPR) repeat protein
MIHHEQEPSYETSFNLAASLDNLAIRLAELGRRDEALAPAEEAVVIRRRLAEANPDAYLPGLAGSLNNLGGRLSGKGRREQALASAEEATRDATRELLPILHRHNPEPTVMWADNDYTGLTGWARNELDLTFNVVKSRRTTSASRCSHAGGSWSARCLSCDPGRLTGPRAVGALGSGGELSHSS